MSRAALYCRLSKEDETAGPGGESESIQTQKALLAAYAQDKGWEIAGVYSDEDYSGADRDRPGFRRLLADAEARRFDILLVKTQSRFTRDMELVERYLHRDFLLWGIRFIALVDRVDTGVQGGKKARQINGLINEWYLEDLSDNIRAVLDFKRREGRFIGSFAPYGYRKDEADHNRLVPDPQAAQVVREIFRRYLAGEGTARIAAGLNAAGVPSPTAYKQEEGQRYRNAGQAAATPLWSRTTVSRILRNPLYTGVVAQGKRRKPSYKSKVLLSVPREDWVAVPGACAPLVDAADFEEAGRLLEAHTRSSGQGERHRLAGLVFCRDCGAAMVKVSSRYKGETHSYLRCGRYAADRGQCASHAVRLDYLENLVTRRLWELLARWFSPEEVPPYRPDEELEAAVSREAALLKGEIGRRDRALKELYLDKASGLLTTEQFREMSGDYAREKAAMSERLARLEETMARQAQPEPAGRALEDFVDREAMPAQLLAAFVERIEVGTRDGGGRQAVRIAWKI